MKMSPLKMLPVMVSRGTVVVYFRGDGHLPRRFHRLSRLSLISVNALLLLLQPCLVGRCRRSHIDLVLLV